MLNAKQARSCFRIRETCFYCWMDAFGFEFLQKKWKCQRPSEFWEGEWYAAATHDRKMGVEVCCFGVAGGMAGFGSFVFGQEDLECQSSKVIWEREWYAASRSFFMTGKWYFNLLLYVAFGLARFLAWWKLVGHVLPRVFFLLQDVVTGFRRIQGCGLRMLYAIGCVGKAWQNDEMAKWGFGVSVHQWSSTGFLVGGY